MTNEEFRQLIHQGDISRLAGALVDNPGLSNRPVHWYLNQDNQSEPLHYVADCVSHGWLTGGRDGDVTALLLEHGAAVDGNKGAESPLVAAASLGAENMAQVLIDAGASLESTSLFGARALHWAAWMGLARTVSHLISAGAEIEPRCSEFSATPLFWAVHGYSPRGPTPKAEQVQAARLLIEAGASADTSNQQGLTALQLSRACERRDMYELLIGST